MAEDEDIDDDEEEQDDDESPEEDSNDVDSSIDADTDSVESDDIDSDKVEKEVFEELDNYAEDEMTPPEDKNPEEQVPPQEEEPEEEEPDDKKPKKFKLFNFPPFVLQYAGRRFGASLGTHLGNDIYYDIKGLWILIDYIRISGDDFLKKEYPDWEEVEEKLRELLSMATDVKHYYDNLEKKQQLEKSVGSEKFEEFIHKASRIPVLETELWSVLTYIIFRSNLQRFIIPAEAIRVPDLAKKQAIVMDKKKTDNSTASATETTTHDNQ